MEKEFTGAVYNIKPGRPAPLGEQPTSVKVAEKLANTLLEIEKIKNPKTQDLGEPEAGK